MKYNKQIIGTLVLMSIIVPQAIFAAATGTPKVRAAADGAMFCQNMDKFLANSEGKMASMKTERNSKMATREAEMLAKRAEKDQKVSDLRAEALTKQDARFNAILAKATTTEQKAAITEFVTAVKSAIAVRQAAVDAARNTFRTEADKVIADRKAGIDAAITARKTAVDIAIAKAKTDCGAGVDSATVRTTLQAEIKSAGDIFKAAVQGYGKMGDSAKTLEATRKAAFEESHNAFKTTMESLKTTLRTELGVK